SSAVRPYLLFSLYADRDHRDLHSFPTRRSSDLSAAISTSNDSWLIPSSNMMSNSAWRNGGATLFFTTFTRTWLPITTSRSVTTRSEEHTSELQSRRDLVCRLLLEKKNKTT